MIGRNLYVEPICGTVLKWFSSYILNQSSSVKICNFSTQSCPLHYVVHRGSVLGPSSSQYKYSLYMMLLVNFQMSTYTYMLMIFNYIPSYLTPPMYYLITLNYVNMHQLSDHGFSLTTFYLTLQNVHSQISHLTIIIILLLSLMVSLSSHR